MRRFLDSFLQSDDAPVSSESEGDSASNVAAPPTVSQESNSSVTRIAFPATPGIGAPLIPTSGNSSSWNSRSTPVALPKGQPAAVTLNRSNNLLLPGTLVALELPLSATSPGGFEMAGDGAQRTEGTSSTRYFSPSDPTQSSRVSPQTEAPRATAARDSQVKEGLQADNMGSSGVRHDGVNDDVQSRGHSLSPPVPPTTAREEKFASLLADSIAEASCAHDAKNDSLVAVKTGVVDLDALQNLAWSGVPPQFRAHVWRLLLSYAPAATSRVRSTLRRKRREYRLAVERFWNVEESSWTVEDKELRHQILIDMPRTCPDLELFRGQDAQNALARVLYVWSVRHPASGYVQGINDLATPLFTVFAAERVAAAAVAATATNTTHMIPAGDASDALEKVLACSNFSELISTTAKALLYEENTDEQSVLLNEIEADTYWCLTTLLDGIQDNYTFAQKGIQRMVHKLEHSIIARLDGDLAEHLEQMDVPFIGFAFRWMNCLLLREMPLPLGIRLWDTYLAEINCVGEFHVFVCAAFLIHFASELKGMDFQELMLFLNKPPTGKWTDTEISLLVSQAFQWRSQLG